jgi:hypothetical protein
MKFVRLNVREEIVPAVVADRETENVRDLIPMDILKAMDQAEHLLRLRTHRTD